MNDTLRTDGTLPEERGKGRAAGLRNAALWVVFATLLYAPLTDVRIGQGNVASDLAAIESLVERGTFFINDSTYFNTLDKLRRDDLYFSQKSPIFHLVAAVPYKALTLAGLTLRESPGVCLRVLTWCMTILPMGLLLAWTFRHPWMRPCPVRVRVGLTLGLALASLFTPFAITLNHYTLASALLLFAHARLVAERPDGRPPGPAEAALPGLVISGSIASDIPPGFIFGLGVAAVWSARALKNPSWLLALGGLAAGAAPVALIYFSLNRHIVGTILPPNLMEGEMLAYEGSWWREMWDRIEAGNPGYYEASWGRRILHATFGHRGIYWMMPSITAITCFAAALAPRPDSGFRKLIPWLLFPPTVVILAMRWTLDLGGGCYMIRHSLAALAPLYCASGVLWMRGPAAFKPVFIAASLCGLAVAAAGLINPWSHNTLSAWPPLENIARHCLAAPESRPTGWIEGLIDNTSLQAEIAWLDLGMAAAGNNSTRAGLARAEDYLSRAILAAPDRPLPYYHLGIVQDRQGKSEAAAITYAKLLELEPGNVGAWNNLGIFNFRAGRIADAADAWAESLRVAPDNATAMWGLLLVEQSAGKADSNHPLLERAITKHPHDGRIQEVARSWGYNNSRSPGND